MSYNAFYVDYYNIHFLNFIRSETPLSSEVQTDTQINVPIERTGWAMTWEERVQLEQQMRMVIFVLNILILILKLLSSHSSHLE